LPTGRHEQFHNCASAYQRCDYRRLGIASKVGTNLPTGRHMKVSQWRIMNPSAVIIAASASVSLFCQQGGTRKFHNGAT
jgi:hypothetical protein